MSGPLQETSGNRIIRKMEGWKTGESFKLVEDKNKTHAALLCFETGDFLISELQDKLLTGFQIP